MCSTKPPALHLADHAVLPRDSRLRLAGRARPGHHVSLAIDREIPLGCVADPAGDWELFLPPRPAGGPHRLVIEAGDGPRVFEDILFGDVWLAAGQSNLAWPLERSTCAAAAIAGADDPQLRFLVLPGHAADRPATTLPPGSAWAACTPRTIPQVSAVAYHFARRLRADTGVPLGVIQAAWGGTPLEAWTAPGPSAPSAPANDPAALDAEEAHWLAVRDHALASTVEFDQGYAAPDFDDGAWPPCPVPGNFEEALGDHDGSVWYRRLVEIPPGWAGRELELSLGVVDDLDHTYWDGELVGRTGVETPGYYATPRRYRIPATLVRPGLRLLAVRVFDEFLSGGFMSDESELWLAPPDAEPARRLPLSGLWRVQAGPAIPSRRMLPGMPWMLPGVLFNGMIAPLLGTPLAGVIWYQGENNVGHANAYARRFPALIADWRARWDRPDLPFLFVQLANHGRRRANPAGSALAELRAAQASALHLTGTGMATAIDLGDETDIHPPEKNEVARRLHLAALGVFSRSETLRRGGPSIGRVTRPRPGLLRVEFDHIIPPLRTRDGAPPAGFAVRAADGSLHRPALTRLEGDAVLLFGPWDTLPAPLEVRHAWDCNPGVNLHDLLRRPALPGRTTEITAGRATDAVA